LHGTGKLDGVAERHGYERAAALWKFCDRNGAAGVIAVDEQIPAVVAAVEERFDQAAP